MAKKHLFDQELSGASISGYSFRRLSLHPFCEIVESSGNIFLTSRWGSRTEKADFSSVEWCSYSNRFRWPNLLLVQSVKFADITWLYILLEISELLWPSMLEISRIHSWIFHFENNESVVNCEFKNVKKHLFAPFNGLLRAIIEYIHHVVFCPHVDIVAWNCFGHFWSFITTNSALCNVNNMATSLLSIHFKASLVSLWKTWFSSFLNFFFSGGIFLRFFLTAPQQSVEYSWRYWNSVGLEYQLLKYRECPLPKYFWNKVKKVRRENPNWSMKSNSVVPPV